MSILTLSLERGCIALHLWRADLPKDIDYDLLFESLDVEYNTVNAHKNHLPLRAYRDDMGNQILIIMHTGRVQFRISTEVDKTQREAVARQMFDTLTTIVDKMMTHTTP